MKTLQWLSFVAVMSLASPSYADERESSGKRDVSGQALIGAAVQTGGGETLGEVTSVIVDESGYARYAVISHGGIMGFGIKRSAVPWATVQSVLQNDSLVIERASIEQAPVLAGSKRPDPLSGTWSRDAECYWGARTSTRETPYARKQAESPHATPIVPAPTPLTERT